MQAEKERKKSAFPRRVKPLEKPQIEIHVLRTCPHTWNPGMLTNSTTKPNPTNLCTGVFLQVPDAHVASLVPRHKLQLVRVQGDSIYTGRALVLLVPPGSAQVPNLHRLVFPTGEHPFGVRLEAHRRHVSRVRLIAPHGIPLSMVDFKDLRVGVPHRSDVVLVVGDGERVHLRVWEAQHSGAFLSARFPKSDLVVVARRREHNSRCH